MVCVTPDTEVPAVNVPAEAKEQVYAETMAEPLEEAEIPAKHFQLAAALVPILVWTQLSVVLKMVQPLAGLVMASRWVLVMRGKSIPWLVLESSNAAFALGVVVPIPICAMLVNEQAITTRVIIILFFILFLFAASHWLLAICIYFFQHLSSINTYPSILNTQCSSLSAHFITSKRLLSR